MLAMAGIIALSITSCKKDDEATKVKGCMDPNSLTYNPNAVEDDGSCTYASNTPSKRVAVVEEYTGVRCTFCPDGHRRAQSFVDAYPGKVVVINVHTGSFASAAAGWPDFTNEFGAAMASKAGMGQAGTGYPGGSISRNTFKDYPEMAGFKMAKGDAYTLLNRGGWWNNGISPGGDIIVGMNAPVNVAVMPKYTAGSREVQVTVELFFTSTVADGAKLNIALLEDNVKGKQIDAGKTIEDYNHKHLLRHLLTGQWGAEISITEAKVGSRVKKSFKYTIPEKDKNGAPIKVEDCKIAAYVTAYDNNDILNGAQAKMIK